MIVVSPNASSVEYLRETLEFILKEKQSFSHPCLLIINKEYHKIDNDHYITELKSCIANWSNVQMLELKNKLLMDYRPANELIIECLKYYHNDFRQILPQLKTPRDKCQVM